MNRLHHRRKAVSELPPFKTAKFTPLQAVARGVLPKKQAVAYIHGKAVRWVRQLPGVPMPSKVQVFRGGVALDDCVLLPFPFSAALQAWLSSQAASWTCASGSMEVWERIYLILDRIECGLNEFNGLDG